jgi:hypothetical protein
MLSVTDLNGLTPEMICAAYAEAEESDQGKLWEQCLRAYTAVTRIADAVAPDKRALEAAVILKRLNAAASDSSTRIKLWHLRQQVPPIGALPFKQVRPLARLVESDLKSAVTWTLDANHAAKIAEWCSAEETKRPSASKLSYSLKPAAGKGRRPQAETAVAGVKADSPAELTLAIQDAIDELADPENRVAVAAAVHEHYCTVDAGSICALLDRFAEGLDKTAASRDALKAIAARLTTVAVNGTGAMGAAAVATQALRSVGDLLADNPAGLSREEIATIAADVCKVVSKVIAPHARLKATAAA